jgi:hypothetical protein
MENRRRPRGATSPKMVFLRLRTNVPDSTFVAHSVQSSQDSTERKTDRVGHTAESMSVSCKTAHDVERLASTGLVFMVTCIQVYQNGEPVFFQRHFPLHRKSPHPISSLTLSRIMLNTKEFRRRSGFTPSRRFSVTETAGLSKPCRA